MRPLLESQFAHVGAGPVAAAAVAESSGEGEGGTGEDEAAAAAPPPSSSSPRSKKQPILLRESPHEFVLWASGRRNLGDAAATGGSGALLRLKLRPRQDAVSTVLAVAEGLPDQLELTLPLPGSGGGVPVALAAGRVAAVREAVEDFADLRRLARAVSPRGAPVKGLPWWPTAVAVGVPGGGASDGGGGGGGGGEGAGGLAAVSDSAQSFADLVASGPLGPALAASARASLASSTGRIVLSPKPRLRLLRLSGDGCLRARPGCEGVPILTAVVDLPALGMRDEVGMRDVVRLVGAVLATADAVAVYGGRAAAAAGTPAAKVMTAEAKAKALALRAAAVKAAEAGEDPAGEGGNASSSSSSAAASAARNLEAKRLAAKEAERAKLASMSSEAKEKYLLKKQRVEQKRLMKRRTVRG